MISKTIEINRLSSSAIERALSECCDMGSVSSSNIHGEIPLNKEVSYNVCCDKLSAEFEIFITKKENDKYSLSFTVYEFEKIGQKKRVIAENLPPERW